MEEDSTNPQIQLAQRKCELYLQQVVTQVGVNALQNQFRLISPTFISPTLILPTEDQFVSFCVLNINFNYNYIITKCKVRAVDNN